MGQKRLTHPTTLVFSTNSQGLPGPSSLVASSFNSSRTSTRWFKSYRNRTLESVNVSIAYLLCRHRPNQAATYPLVLTVVGTAGYGDQGRTIRLKSLEHLDVGRAILEEVSPESLDDPRSIRSEMNSGWQA